MNAIVSQLDMGLAAKAFEKISLHTAVCVKLDFKREF